MRRWGPGALWAGGRWILAVLLAVGNSGMANAQMYLPDPRIKVDDTTNVYFGSIRDAEGRLLSDVTVAVTGENTTYVMVTDDAGRFRILVPKDLPLSRHKFSCSRPGYVLVRAVKRPPPKGATTPIQVDCVLTPESAAAK